MDLAKLMFERMKNDINKFVDNTYAPYQIKAAMDRQQALAKSSDQTQRNKSLLLAINAAFKPNANPDLQALVLKAMGSLVTKVRNDIEKMRSDLLTPLNQQEETVLGSINRAYQKIHYANSIVTGHLASVVKVHETQAELLDQFGVEKDLREEVGQGLAKASSKITSLVDKGEKAVKKLEDAEKTAKSIKDTITNLGKAVSGE
ncbi:MAG: hypothetical protein GY935_20970 [Gammaproteobacteria bacterium]|nr:hypothetical protein [Gammaproteobacteria bacterium]